LTGLSPLDSQWFALDELANQAFWENFGGTPSFQGASVLDVGCARGSLCFQMALLGAARTIGADINPVFIEFARATLRERYPRLLDCVSFDVGDLSRYADNTFDYIISKDTFEHIVNLGEMVAEMKRCLKPGGRIYTGYGPLYNAPNGPHGFFGVLPWGHVFLPERLLVALVNRKRSDKITCLRDLGVVNQMSFAEHRAVLWGAGLKVKYFEVNRSRHALSRAFVFLRRIPFLEEYFTHNIYCILEKESA
jgi:SAM-dependent methyltransferase